MFLFPCSNRRRETLPRRLSQAGIPVEEITVYETHLIDHMDFSSAPAPERIVFFRPSGVQSLVTGDGMDWGAVRKAAIGPTTAAAVEMAFGRVDAIAKTPTSEALVTAVQHAEND